MYLSIIYERSVRSRDARAFRLAARNAAADSFRYNYRAFFQTLPLRDSPRKSVAEMEIAGEFIRVVDASN